MLKILGSVCILIAGGVVRSGCLRACRREMNLLRDLIAALEEIRNEIRLNRTPMPRILNRIEKRSSGDSAAFFRAVSSSTAESLSLAWETEATALPLREEDVRAVVGMGKKLSGDEETICNGISLVCSQLQRTLSERQAKMEEVDKRNTALCFSASALLIILLI